MSFWRSSPWRYWGIDAITSFFVTRSDLARLVRAVTCGCGCAAAVATAALVVEAGAPAGQTFVLFVVRNGASALIGVAVNGCGSPMSNGDVGDSQRWPPWRHHWRGSVSPQCSCGSSGTIPGLPLAFVSIVPALWLALRWQHDGDHPVCQRRRGVDRCCHPKDRGVFIVPEIPVRALLAQAMVCSLTLVVLALSLYRDSRNRLIGQLDDARIQADRSAGTVWRGARQHPRWRACRDLGGRGRPEERPAADSSAVTQILGPRGHVGSGDAGVGPQHGVARDLVLDTANEPRVVELATVPLVHQPQLTVMAFRDVTDAREHARKLREAALHDPLTGLANRTLLQERIETALAEADHADSQRVGLVYPRP